MDEFGDNSFVSPQNLTEAEQKGMVLKSQIASGLAQQLFSCVTKLNSTEDDEVDLSKEIQAIKQLIEEYQSQGRENDVDYPDFNKLIMGMGPPGKFSEVLQLNLSDYTSFHTFADTKLIVISYLKLFENNSLSIKLISTNRNQIKGVQIQNQVIQMTLENGSSTKFPISEAIEKYPDHKTENMVIDPMIELR